MAENSQAVIPDNLIIVDGEIGLPSSTASDAGKVLAVDAEGDPSWVTPSGGTLYTEGTGIEISDQNVVSIDTTVVATKTDLSGLQGELTAGTGIDITNDTISVDTSVIATQNDISGLQPTLTAGDNISISNNTISATDTTYTAGTGLSLTGTEFAVDTTVIASKSDLPSSDELLPSATSSDEGKVLTIDSQGEAGWATPASVDEVPAVTSNDDGKVLKATYSGGVGSYAWATESGGGSSYTAGTGIDISAQNEISVDTTVVATQTDIGNVRQVPSSTSSDENKVLTVNSSGVPEWAAAQGGSSDIFIADNTSTNDDVFQAFLAGKVLFYKDASNGIYNLTCTGEFTADRARYTVFSGYRSSYLNAAEFANVTVFSVTIQSYYGEADSNLFSASITNKNVRVLNTPLLGGNAGKVLTVNSGATGVEWANAPTELPASTSVDEDKVLTVNSSGNPVWATAQGGTTYTAGNMISLANDAVAVSTTAGITDIQLVNALPASPVATVLYLIPET